MTHSNHALNDLFEKIMERDIDERYLLRLGHGADSLTGEADFSKFGRVNYMLKRRLDLLGEVAGLAQSLGMSDDVAYTCETAGHFFLYHVLARWEKFQSDLKKAEAKGESEAARHELLVKSFPFAKFFTKGGAALFGSGSLEQDAFTAESCFLNIKEMFTELEECRPFELLRTYKDRGAYLVTKHAKVRP